jgi:bacterioferritin
MREFACAEILYVGNEGAQKNFRESFGDFGEAYRLPSKWMLWPNESKGAKVSGLLACLRRAANHQRPGKVWRSGVATANSEAGTNGSQPGAEQTPYELGSDDGRILKQALSDDASLDESVIDAQRRIGAHHMQAPAATKRTSRPAGRRQYQKDRDDRFYEDLSREYQAIIAYVVYSQVLKGAEYMEYMSIADQLEAHAHDELQHALIISRQIDYLGKISAVTPKPVGTSGDPQTKMRPFVSIVRECEALGEFAMAE